MPPTLLICAAEPSGDRLAAALVEALRARGPLRARGIAGPAMRAAGVEPIFPTEALSVMGASEILGRLGAIWRARRAVKGALSEGADAFIGVDSPDFNLPLAARAKAMGIPAIGYVAPQVWAWRPGRAARVAARLDRLLCLFPFEPELFPGLDARWVGHPAVDRVTPRDPAEVDPDLFALLPGSRHQELARHLPLFLATAERLRERAQQEGRPSPRFLLLCPPELAQARTLGASLPADVRRVHTLDALRGARAALTKSGTVTLELAVLGLPMVVAHRVSGLTYRLGRWLVRGVKHIALPNILADRALLPAPVPELIQADDPALLAELLLGLPAHQEVPLDLLGAPGQAARAAAAIADLLESP